MLEAANKAGRSLAVAPKLKQMMIDAGFTDVVEVVYKWPQNKWPKNPKYKELGAWQQLNLQEGLQAFSRTHDPDLGHDKRRGRSSVG